MNEFFEYCTEWEPCSSLYFGDNVLQVKLLFAWGLERNELNQVAEAVIHLLHLFLGCLSPKEIYFHY